MSAVTTKGYEQASILVRLMDKINIQARAREEANKDANQDIHE
jgi:hypothetical protein